MDRHTGLTLAKESVICGIDRLKALIEQYQKEIEESQLSIQNADKLLANPNLKKYEVILHEDKGDKFKLIFPCYATCEDDAEHQALTEYPCGEVVDVWERNLSIKLGDD